jgi:hypothetical protein
MIHILSLLLLVTLTGCDQVSRVVEYFTPASVDSFVAPCYVETVEQVDGKAQARVTDTQGFKHIETVKDKQRLISHCLPCAKAKGSREVLACEGGG